MTLGISDILRRRRSEPQLAASVEEIELERDHVAKRAALAETDGLFDGAIPAWYSDNLGVGGGVAHGNARLAERVWVANRCQQMNSQQIASMPLEYHGPATQSEPSWVSNPDPILFPNGIGDAVHTIVDQCYGWGYCLLYFTDFYADGFPRTWTVLDSALIEPRIKDGVRVYQPAGGGDPLNADRILQIDRNPGTRAHGTSALRAYAQLGNSILAAGAHTLSVTSGGIPFAYLKSKRPLDEGQAEAIQKRWMERTAQRNGAPPVLPPDVDAEELNINPSDLALLETQEFGARAICTAYGVPSVLLNLALQGGLTYQNPAALGEMWWRFELRTTATRIANAMSARLLPRGQWVSFRAEDTFAPLTNQSPTDDEQAAVDAGNQPPALPAAGQATPAQGRLAAV